MAIEAFAEDARRRRARGGARRPARRLTDRRAAGHRDHAHRARPQADLGNTLGVDRAREGRHPQAERALRAGTSSGGGPPGDSPAGRRGRSPVARPGRRFLAAAGSAWSPRSLTSATTPPSRWRWPWAVATRLGRPLDYATVAEALEGTTWPGRLERAGPDLLLDCAHNGEGARALAAALPEIAAGRRIVFLMSIAEDKDVRGILAALGPLAYALVATHADSPRALPAAALAAEAGAVLFEAQAAVADQTAALARLAGAHRWAGRRLRLDVPGRSAAGCAARRNGRSAADLRSAIDEAGDASDVRSLAPGLRRGYQPATCRLRGTALRRGGMGWTA